MRLRERLIRFMAGRYGMDDLSRLCTGVSVICLLISMFTKWQWLNLLAFAILGYVYFRMFSRNIGKRMAENQKLLNFRYRAIAWWNQKKQRHEQKKIYRFFKCPGCKQKVRVPKGKGKIVITCPKCRNEFQRRS